MERNVDKIKRLEHELGRWRKKVADTAKENEKLREALDQADVGNQETQALVDAVLTAVVLEHGEQAMDPDAPETALGWRLAVPFFSVKEMREKYEIHARRGEDGKYILGVMERRSDLCHLLPRQGKRRQEQRPTARHRFDRAGVHQVQHGRDQDGTARAAQDQHRGGGPSGCRGGQRQVRTPPH